LVLGLRLPEDVIWEADNKDTGRTLVAGKTLHQNGVRAGHHLYLKSRPRFLKILTEYRHRRRGQFRSLPDGPSYSRLL
jgi:hypothetical protein